MKKIKCLPNRTVSGEKINRAWDVHIHEKWLPATNDLLVEKLEARRVVESINKSNPKKCKGGTMIIKYRRSHFEGTGTSYSWSDPIYVMLMRESKYFLTVLSQKIIEGRKPREDWHKQGSVYRLHKDQVEVIEDDVIQDSQG